MDLAGWSREEIHPGRSFFAWQRLSGDRVATLMCEAATTFSNIAAPATRIVYLGFHGAFRTDPDIGGWLTELNSTFRDSLGGGFLTVFLGVADPARRELTYQIAGGPNSFVYRAQEDTVEGLSPTVPALGLVEFDRIEPHQIGLNAGDTLLCVNDGVMEVNNAGHDEFGKDRLVGWFADACDADASAHDLLLSLRTCLDDFGRPDVTQPVALVARI